MNKVKVYLAKSNLCDPDAITRVRALLTRDNIELLEYRGGTYNNKDLLKADYMVVIPYYDSWQIDRSDTSDWKCFVGAGVYQQMVDFGKSENIFFLNDTEYFTYARIKSIDIYNLSDYKTERAVVSFIAPHLDLRESDIFSFLDSADDLKTSDSIKRYLLLCKP